MRLFSMFRVSTYRESGATLLETVVALAVLGTIAVTFLSGLVTTSKAAFMADERATAESLAQSQMEWAQNYTYFDAPYDYTSAAPTLTGEDYVDYSANITAALLPGHSSDDDIQKITVIVTRSGEQVFTLEGYKVYR
ncbi:hypothetical protein ACFLWC_00470 [Chloroflexota bacterium]